MSADRLRLAAHKARETTDQYPPGVGLALAATMELEASLLESMPPLAELLSLTIEHQTGIKGYVKFAEKPDGSPHMHAESTSGLLAIADLILGGAS